MSDTLPLATGSHALNLKSRKSSGLADVNGHFVATCSCGEWRVDGDFRVFLRLDHAAHLADVVAKLEAKRG